jgi:hypothetical protein
VTRFWRLFHEGFFHPGYWSYKTPGQVVHASLIRTACSFPSAYVRGQDRTVSLAVLVTRTIITAPSHINLSAVGCVVCSGGGFFPIGFFQPGFFGSGYWSASQAGGFFPLGFFPAGFFGSGYWSDGGGVVVGASQDGGFFHRGFFHRGFVSHGYWHDGSRIVAPPSPIVIRPKCFSAWWPT